MKLDISHLTQKYGSVLALDDISISFTEGVYGILGPNGAGKSTLLNLLTDNVCRTSGEILYNDKPILSLKKDYRKMIGYMPQQQGFYENFSPRMFLMYMSKLKAIPSKKATAEVDRLLKIVSLEPVADSKISTFSGGMKQRVLLADALMGDPKILFLDEPTAGLDPKERINIRNFISQLSKNKIIFFATHVVSDIECIADSVILLKNGKIIKQGTPIELIDSVSGHVAQTISSKNDLDELQKKYPIHNIFQKRAGYMFRIVGDKFENEFTIVKDDISLEDVYLYYVARNDN